MAEVEEHKEQTEVKVTEKFRFGNKEIIALVVIGLLAVVLLYNTIRITNIAGGGTTGQAILASVSASEIIPTGTPKTYGKELGINYDDVSPNDPRKADSTIDVMSNIDRTVTLEGADLQRYIDITSQISCEYCCGAKSIIFSNGDPACGCAHSYAMRGLAKYLITKHGNEFTDDQILEELGKWKVLFFPGIHETKAAALKSQGIELNYINLASNKYRGIEKGASSSGGMVGGC